jgi:hypothetical protein
MASYISLEVAKAHLRVTDVTEDDDIQRKLEQATDTIVRYLKSQAHTRATVTSSSVANPTVLTTDAAHGFVTGDTVIISGHSGSTPAIAGSYVATVVTTTTFTIPVAVTVAGTGGLAIVEWTEVTVPGEVKSATLLLLTHMFEHRDDLRPDEDVWLAIRRLLERSRDPALA